MPRPIPGRGQILVRVAWSLISAGTETSAMRALPHPPEVADDAPGLFIKRSMALPGLDQWQALGEARIRLGTALEVETGPGEYAYAASSPTLTLESGWEYAVTAQVKVIEGNLSLGILADDGSRWLVTQHRHYPSREMFFRLDYHAREDAPVRLVFSNHQPASGKRSIFEIQRVEVICWRPLPPEAETPENPLARRAGRFLKGAVRNPNWAYQKVLEKLRQKRAQDQIEVVDVQGLPVNDMAHQGWNLGYSCAGVVEELGSQVDGYRVGDAVACAGAGFANHAEYVVVPVNLTARVPEGLSLRAAASTTVGAIALQGVRRTGTELGDKIAVIGLGLLGQFSVQLLRASGAEVYGLDLSPERVDTAKRMGLAGGAADEAEFKTLLQHATDGHGVDAVIVAAATPSNRPLNLALEVCRRKGRVVLLGDVGLEAQRPEFYKKEIDLVMSTSYGPGRYDRAYELEGQDYPYAYVRWTSRRNMKAWLDCLADGRVDFLSLVDGEFEVAQAPAAYHALAQTQRRPLAVLLRFPQAEDREPDAAAPRIALKGGPPTRQGPRRFVLVGAGAFAQSMLTPRMLECPDYFQPYGLVSRDAARGGNFARQIGFARLASDLDAMLGDPQVDAFVIATRHDRHATQVLRCLGTGKPVFVEKPLATTWEDLAALDDFLKRSGPSPSLMVGFNRRFSPTMQALRDRLAGRRAPLQMVYRLNAGYIAPDHWIQGPEGGGRNIGEACHFYDCFRSLSGAPVVSIQAGCIGPTSGDVLRSDNFSATIGYADGSLATLIYTAQGPRQGLPKERLEVFCDGRAWILDDYRALHEVGLEQPLWIGETDKGHAEELRLWGAHLAGQGPPPIDVGELLETTAVALCVEDLLWGRAS